MDQVAVLIDFENLVIGAEGSLPGHSDPVPYAAIELVCSDYGNAAIRRAYADWAKPQFNRYQENLALNGVDLIHITRFGVAQKNAADVRMAVDAMELLFTHPDLEVFILVAGDGDYSPLVQRLREFGKRVVGVGTEASASRRLVSVCSEYKYWATLVAQVDPSARVAAEAEFDIADAERLLVTTLTSVTQPIVAAGLKNKMKIVDPSFDERNYGCRNFRDFLTHVGDIVNVEQGQDDLIVSLKSDEITASSIAESLVGPSHDEPPLVVALRGKGSGIPIRPETRDALLASIHDAWRAGRLERVRDIPDALLDEETGFVPNKATRLGLARALIYPDAAVIPLAEQPEPDVRSLNECRLAPYDGSDSAEWTRRAHIVWLAWVMYRLADHDDLENTVAETLFSEAPDYGRELVTAASEVMHKRRTLSASAE